jgi:hypothetical protein
MALTAAQIVNLALTTVQAPGWTAQAGQILNVILADLADNQDLDLCRGNFQFDFVVDNGSGNGSGPYPLPLDYKRAEKAGVFYTYNGVPYYLKSIDYTEYLMQVQQAGIANFPVFFATDISPLGQEPPSNPNMYVWPPASSAFPVTVIYRRLLADIDTPQTSTEVPWFPNQGYLIAELEARMAKLVGDPRSEMFFREAVDRLRNFMQLTNDDEGRAKKVTLDSRRFGRNFNQLPDTKLVGW